MVKYKTYNKIIVKYENTTILIIKYQIQNIIVKYETYTQQCYIKYKTQKTFSLNIKHIHNNITVKDKTNTI